MNVHFFMSGERRPAFRHFVADADRGKTETGDLEKRVSTQEKLQEAFTRRDESLR